MGTIEKLEEMMAREPTLDRKGWIAYGDAVRGALPALVAVARAARDLAKDDDVSIDLTRALRDLESVVL